MPLIETHIDGVIGTIVGDDSCDTRMHSRGSLSMR